MSDTLRSALLFLLNSLFDLYLFVLMVRIILVWVRSNYFNPVTQFVVRVTDFLVQPMRKVIPNFRHIEIATVVLALLVEMLKFFLISCLSYGMPNPLGLPILAFADILYLLIKTFTYAIILQAILSFVQPSSPLAGTLARFVSPVMRPVQRLVPPVGGIDLSPIPALIGLQLLSIVLVGPLMTLGQGVAFG